MHLARPTILKLSLIGILTLCTLLSFLAAPEFAYRGGCIYLQHLGTLILMTPLFLSLRKNSTADSFSLICLSLFTGLHILGGTYLYSYVPYDKWLEELFHFSVEKTGVHDNKYDRLIHFSFGLLMMPYLAHLCRKFLKGARTTPALLGAWLSIQTYSLLYEVFEWLLSVVMSADFADGYNGQQGDMWDAQKDMAWALLGSTITLVLLWLCQRRRNRQGGSLNGQRGRT